MSSRQLLAILALVIALVIALALVAAVPVRAGYYTVPGTCGHWAGWGGQVAIYPACPELVARNIGRSELTPYGAGGGWRFDAPPGTAIATAGCAVRWQVATAGRRSWSVKAFRRARWSCAPE